MKNIVIVGAGFAGVTAALGLEKKFKNNKEISITLVNKNDYQLFLPSLYEAATSEEELVTISQIKKSIALPIKEIVQNKKIQFIQGEFTGIDQKEKTINVGIKKLSYDYLVIATGSKPNYFKITGALEYALPLKSLSDALRMRNRIEFSIQSHSHDLNKQPLRFVIVGGGYTAVELAGELKNLLDFLSWKYSYPRKYLEIVIINSSGELVPGFCENLSQDAYGRILDLGIKVQFHQRVIKADRHFVECLSGEKIQYELLFWAGGVAATELPINLKANKKIKNRIETDSFLRIKGSDDIFVAGDLSYVEYENGKPVFQSAQDAIHQGKYVAYALPIILQNKTPNSYKPKKHGFIVNISGKWAILSIKPFYLTGYLAYLVNLAAHFGYYYSVLGLKKAFRYVIREMDLYSRND